MKYGGRWPSGLYTYTLLNASTLNTLSIISCNQPVEHNIAQYYIVLRGNLFAGNYFNCHCNIYSCFHLIYLLLYYYYYLCFKEKFEIWKKK